MKTRRIAVTDRALASGDTIELTETLRHYLVDVLRCHAGQPLELFDGEGACFRGELIAVAPARVVVGEMTGAERESPCRVTLFQAIPKGDRFELVIEKATELGVTTIVPIETARSVVRIPGKKTAAKVERWLRIAESAARQSGRTMVPEVAEPLSLREALTREVCDVELLLHTGGTSVSLIDALPPGALDVAVWVGPEGGFDDDEVLRLATRATAITLGPRVLRSETAGIVACALVQQCTGGLQ